VRHIWIVVNINRLNGGRFAASRFFNRRSHPRQAEAILPPQERSLEPLVPGIGAGRPSSAVQHSGFKEISRRKRGRALDAEHRR
jgi:hypothetical protein